MALEDLNNLEKTVPAAQEPAAEAEHGAVKKKIDIPGVGEIEYTEKRIMFPEKIVQETGGVKGYVRKMVSWKDLARFYGVKTEEMKKMKSEEMKRYNDLDPSMLMEGEEDLLPSKKLLPSDEAKDKYGKVGGILPIISAMTNGEFVKETLNHIVGGHININSEGIVSKDCMLDKFLDLGNKKLSMYSLSHREFRAYDRRNKKELQESKDGEVESLIKKYQKGGMSEEVYFVTIDGLNVTNRGTLWQGQSFKNDTENTYSEDQSVWSRSRAMNTPFLYDIIVGFKPNTQNSVLKKYCQNVLKIKIIEEIYSRIEMDDDFCVALDKIQCKAAMRTLELLKSNNDKNKHEDREKPFIISKEFVGPNDGNHPLIPIIINHPDIPELRWCHADYAAIPTKNGYNVLEMIT
jgi:hypothetical protein